MRLGNVLCHDEVDCSLLRPRHPILCYQDLSGLGIVVVMMLYYRPSFLVATLPIIGCMVYVTSTVYHCLPYSKFWHKVDHQMIVLLTGGTFISYWSTLLPAAEMLWRLPLLLSLTAAVSFVRWRYFEWSMLGGVLYVALAAFPLTTSFYELQQWLSPWSLIGFWAGIACYGVNLTIHSLQRPDPLPGFFGFRELQHVFVLPGITLQSLVVMQNL